MENKRNISFQGLRGYAILLIVFSHLEWKYGFSGAVGVSIFIFLSGWLACEQTVYRNYDYSFRYIVHRFMKFYPLYVIMLFVSSSFFSAKMIFGVSDLKNIVIFITNLLMIQTWTPNIEFWGGFLQTGWYIPIVALSIILTPLFKKVWNKMKTSHCVIFVIAIVILNVIAAWMKVLDSGINVKWPIYGAAFWRIFEFFAGGCACIMYKNIKCLWKYVFDGMVLLGLVMQWILMALSVKSEYYQFFYTAAWIIPTILLLIGVQESKYTKLLFDNPIIVWIGDISFEIFLTHIAVMQLVSMIYIEAGFFVRLVCIIIAAFVVHTISKWVRSTIRNIVDERKKDFNI